MTSLAGYELEKELGRGATATVYRARCSQGTPLCLKVFHPGTKSEVLRRRIEREAELASQLHHPHIVRVHRVVETPDSTALVMDLVEGEDLQSFQRHFPYLFPELALWVGIPLLRALEYAHKKGIIHRDLKPANVLIGREGSVRVTDFGLARVSGSQLTQLSQPLMGTVDFMAPEQARGDMATEASDLYSVGAILYFLVTGAPPVSGMDALASLQAIQNGDIEPPQERNPKVSAALSRILQKSMALKPEDRYRSAVEFRVALEEYLVGLDLSESRMTLGDWISDSGAFTLDALKTAAEALTRRCEKCLDAGDTNGFLETLAHLSQKAPSSPALVRLNEAFGRRRERKRGWWMWGAAGAGAVAAIFGIVRLGPDRLPTYPEFGPPAQLASPAPVTVSETRPIPSKPRVVSLVPSAPTGALKFEVDPSVSVFLNGRRVDTSRPLGGLKPGKHFVLFEKEGFDPIREEVEVKANEETVIRVR